MLCVKIAIVATTINKPEYLEKYIENFEKNYIDPRCVSFIVVGDNKSNVEDADYAENISDDWHVEYWGPNDQEFWLCEHFPDISYKEFRLVVPDNTPRRRNFGFLRAIEMGASYMIAIDDDNLPLEDGDDWLSKHLDAIKPTRDAVKPTRQDYISSSGLINPCDILEMKLSDDKTTDEERIYIRGFPINHMLYDKDINTHGGRPKLVVANMGLWKNKPDVDAYTNIRFPELKSVGIKKEHKCYDNIYASEHNYFPINTQNTIVNSDALKVWFQPHMEKEIGIDRHDDIWSGFILEKIAHHFGHTFSFGEPLTNHDRNTHDFAQDLRYEFNAAALNTRMFETIIHTGLHGDDYLECYEEIIDAIENNMPMYCTSKDVLDYFEKLIKSMRTWVKMVRRLDEIRR